MYNQTPKKQNPAIHLDPQAKMCPKYCSMPVALRMRAPIKSGRTTTTRNLLATYIIPRVGVPMLEQPIGQGTSSSSSLS